MLFTKQHPRILQALGPTPRTSGATETTAIKQQRPSQGAGEQGAYFQEKIPTRGKGKASSKAANSQTEILLL